MIDRLNQSCLKPEAWVIERLKELGSSPIKNVISLSHLLRRNEIYFDDLKFFDPDIVKTEECVAEEVETRIKYEGYINHQEKQVEKTKRMEEMKLPEDMDYQAVYGLSREAKEKLSRVRPTSLGQASRISGITPAALMAIQIHLRQRLGRKSPGVPPEREEENQCHSEGQRQTLAGPLRR